jgi:hypothetical protein
LRFKFKHFTVLNSIFYAEEVALGVPDNCFPQQQHLQQLQNKTATVGPATHSEFHEKNTIRANQISPQFQQEFQHQQHQL